jgi:hypothetical protein
MSTPLDRLRKRLDRKAAARRNAPRDQESTAEGSKPTTRDTDSLAPLPAAEGADAADPGAPPPEPAEPRLVQRVVWGYEVGVLPVPWLMGFKRLKATLERAGFAIRVDLLPLSSLPADVDLLFVPDELAEAAREAAPDARVVALEGRPESAVFQTLVDQLRAGTELRAPLVPPPAGEEAGAPADAPRGTIVRYRGWERID